MERNWNVRMLGFASRIQHFSACLSILPGHSSVRITEKKQDAPCARARQEQLEQSMRKAWK